MKPSDFMDEHKHANVQVHPKTQADMDTLQAKFNTFTHAVEQASRFLSIWPVRPEPKIMRFGAATVIEMPGGDTPFMGVGVCVECLKLSIGYLRETADTLETLVAEAEKVKT